MEEVRTGVLLINLGTPDSPRVRDVRRYLREFLSDPLVLDLPPLRRWLLLNLLILPFRPRVSARAYAKIWTPEGSPLLVHGRALRAALAESLGEGYAVELGMRYGRPSIRTALERLAAADPARILALPMFPQYSRAATGSAVARLRAEIDAARDLAPVEILEDFHSEPRFVSALAEQARPHLAAFRPDFVLFSYHGLPERQVRDADSSGAHCLARADCCDAVGAVNARCYRAQCFATSRALAVALGIDDARAATSFQSRLGRTPWILPHTDARLPELATAGVKRLAVLCPSFVADCLETLEEIGIRAREQWRSLGGEALDLVPCLNAHPAWVAALTAWFRQRA